MITFMIVGLSTEVFLKLSKIKVRISGNLKTLQNVPKTLNIIWKKLSLRLNLRKSLILLQTLDPTILKG
jgi:hypothetical protein